MVKNLLSCCVKAFSLKRRSSGHQVTLKDIQRHDHLGIELGSKNTSTSTWNYWDDLPPEEEDELIEKMAQHIVKRKLGLIAQITLETLSPITRLGAELGMTILGPYLEFFGVEKVTALFRRRENLKRLMDRIEELEEEQKGKKKKEKE
jgi:hypothetical protein